jgi:5-methylthioadenosine/S-adenosylhomocysteine deaminase
MPDMLIRADWVLPVSANPIRDGAIAITGDRIEAVGPFREIGGRYPSFRIEHFPGCTITPGLVNAHTHLTLTALAGVVPPLPFAQWLPRLVAALKPWTVADHEASGVIGAEECLLAGVTAVGDIAYGAAEVTRASHAGLGGVFYWELLGIEAGRIGSTLRELRYPAVLDAYGPRVVCGLSPHSPYTSGPGLLRAVHDTAASLGVPTAIHVSESLAEVQLLADGCGPLAATAARTARGFEPPHMSTTAYLASLGALDGATVVHVCHLGDDDFALLARNARGVVTCPRSNRYLDNPPPSVATLLTEGLVVGIGTDSSASNADLDLMSEVRTVRDAEPELSARTLLELATAGGARAIGVDDRIGAISTGLLADLAIFSVGVDDDPEEAVVLRAGSDTLRAVMSSGVWRVRDGELVTSDPLAAAQANGARQRSMSALASD